MWIKTYSKEYENVQGTDIWRLWEDVNNWPEFHEDLEYCQLEGPFEVGNHFMLKPKGVGAVKIVLTAIDKGKSFTDCTTFFGAKMYDTHEMEITPKGLKLTNTLIVTGPLKWIWIKLVAQNIANTVSEELDALVAMARLKHG